MILAASRRNAGASRRGFSLVEATVAVVLLLVALSTATRAVSWVLREGRSLDDRTVALREAEHVLDRLVSGELVENPSELSPEAARVLSNGKIEIDRVIDRWDDGMAMERIRVSVSFEDRSGFPVAPVRLTTWVVVGEDGS